MPNDILKTIIDEIWNASQPSSVTNEMVARVLDELLSEIRAEALVGSNNTQSIDNLEKSIKAADTREVLPFEARCTYTGIISPTTTDEGGVVLYDTAGKRFILAQSKLPDIPGSGIGSGSGSDLEAVAPGSGLGGGSGSGTGIVMGVSLIDDGADLSLLSQLLRNSICYASWPGSERYNNADNDGHPFGGKVYIQTTPAIARIYDGADLAPVGTTDSGDITRAADGRLSLTERAKRAHFADLWLAAGNIGGKQYSAVSDDLSEWTLNGIALTYAEAIEVWLLQAECCAGRFFPAAFYNNNKFRTLFPIDLKGNIQGVSLMETFTGCSKVEKIVLLSANHITDLRWAFSGCSSLREIEGVMGVSGAYALFGLDGCTNLETVYLKGVKDSIPLASSSKISLASLQYLITNAANTKAITVTVHPDVYARITDETNAEWHALLSQAAEKNIAFATT